jgi:hypothetical protein
VGRGGKIGQGEEDFLGSVGAGEGFAAAAAGEGVTLAIGGTALVTGLGVLAVPVQEGSMRGFSIAGASGAGD